MPEVYYYIKILNEKAKTKNEILKIILKLVPEIKLV